jgi:hypothetical protein
MIDKDPDSEGIEGGLGMSVYNTFWQLVHKAEVLNGNLQMDLPSGIYLFDVRQEESGLSFTARVIRR